MPRWSPALLAAAVLAGCMPGPSARPAPEPVRIERPIPYPVTPPAGYQRAIANGTRTATGAPGPRYWQNSADYTLRARIDPAAKRLEGSGTIVYHNRSPDALTRLHVDLTMNHHAPGVVRNEPAEVTGGVELRRVVVNGQAMTAGSGYRVDGTRMVITPAAPVAPGQSAQIAIDWSFRIPEAGGGGRMGWNSDDFFYLAYWYPQVAVYDDVLGWHPDQFRGTAEFYSDFSSYDLTVEAPQGWVVMGTGELLNPADALPGPFADRLRLASRSDTVVHVLTPADFARPMPARTDVPAWRFRSQGVRDVAFTVARNVTWDATRTPVGDRDGDGATDYTLINAIWRPLAPRWRNAAAYAAHSIRFLSEYTGVPYPWPHMTAVEGEGIIGGGMEYPMMTLIGAYNTRGDSALYYVVAHELAHMWVPMIAGVDERRFGWLDEGMTTFHEAQARKDYFPGSAPELEDRAGYLDFARASEEGEIMRRSDFHYSGGAYGTASYPKPAVAFASLRGVMGQARFERGWRQFLRDWAWKKPQPWDFFNAMEAAAGEDLDWFWRTWFYETWTLDQAVRSVTVDRAGATIVLDDLGNAPMPARVTVTRESGGTETLEVPVQVWLRGARSTTITLPTTTSTSPIVRVEIDAANEFPDIDRANNVWPRP